MAAIWIAILVDGPLTNTSSRAGFGDGTIQVRLMRTMTGQWSSNRRMDGLQGSAPGMQTRATVAGSGYDNTNEWRWREGGELKKDLLEQGYGVHHSNTQHHQRKHCILVIKHSIATIKTTFPFNVQNRIGASVYAKSRVGLHH